MPKLGQYKQRPILKPDPTEEFKYGFELCTPHNEEFSRWLYYELVNTVQWNPSSIFETKIGYDFHYPGYWKICIHPLTKRVMVHCNAKFFSIRKGLKFNVRMQSLTIN